MEGALLPCPIPENQDHHHRHDEGPENRAEASGDPHNGGDRWEDHGQAGGSRHDALDCVEVKPSRPVVASDS